MHRVVRVAPLVLLLAAACARPAPLVPREEAIRRATEDAARARPELAVLEARVDGATAGLLAGDEAVRRADGHAGPIWWVTVRGRFRFQGTGPAGGGGALVLAADEQEFTYDARTCSLIGGQVRTRPAP